MKRYLWVLPALLMASGINNSYAQKVIQIKGSDTLVNLVQRLAEVYMEKNPDRALAVTGGGSGTGIAALINGKCDIANSSRLMKAEEIKQANDKGIDPKRVDIAIDGLSVITNSKNPVANLTVDAIGKIFRGEITNWKEAGGSDMAISLYGRQANSGAFVFFRDEVLKGDYSQKMKHMNGSAQLVEAVKQDVSGIAYVGVGYLKEAEGINIVKVAFSAGADYAGPLNPDDVISGKYPIARPLYQYTNGAPKGAIMDFITFELSEEGQRVVEEEGYFPIPEQSRKLP